MLCRFSDTDCKIIQVCNGDIPLPYYNNLTVNIFIMANFLNYNDDESQRSTNKHNFVSLYACDQQVVADHFIKRSSQSNHNFRDFFTDLIGIYKIM